MRHLVTRLALGLGGVGLLVLSCAAPVAHPAAAPIATPDPLAHVGLAGNPNEPWKLTATADLPRVVAVWTAAPMGKNRPIISED